MCPPHPAAHHPTASNLFHPNPPNPPNSAAHQKLSKPDNCVSIPRSGQTTREFGCVSGRGSRPSLCRTPTKLCVCRQKGGQCTHTSARDRDMLCTSWSSLCYVSNCSNLLVSCMSYNYMPYDWKVIETLIKETGHVTPHTPNKQNCKFLTYLGEFGRVAGSCMDHCLAVTLLKLHKR